MSEADSRTCRCPARRRGRAKTPPTGKRRRRPRRRRSPPGGQRVRPGRSAEAESARGAAEEEEAREEATEAARAAGPQEPAAGTSAVGAASSSAALPRGVRARSPPARKQELTRVSARRGTREGEAAVPFSDHRSRPSRPPGGFRTDRSRRSRRRTGRSRALARARARASGPPRRSTGRTRLGNPRSSRPPARSSARSSTPRRRRRSRRTSTRRTRPRRTPASVWSARRSARFARRQTRRGTPGPRGATLARDACARIRARATRSAPVDARRASGTKSHDPRFGRSKVFFDDGTFCERRFLY